MKKDDQADIREPNRAQDEDTSAVGEKYEWVEKYVARTLRILDKKAWPKD